jgi:hypothetical protein
LTSPTINVNSGGTFNMTGGSLACTTFDLNGGSASLPISVTLDSGTPLLLPSSSVGFAPSVFNVSSGVLTTLSAYLGYNGGVSTYIQPAGLSLDAGTLYVAYSPAATAEYDFGAGSLTGIIDVGYAGTATFVQTGGNVGNSFGITIGSNAGSSGIYLLCAGSLVFQPDNPVENIGYSGAGELIQTGGTNSVAGGASSATLRIGANPGSAGIYVLSGGALYVDGPTTGSDIGLEDVGSGGTGSFVQTGGCNQIGTAMPGAPGYGVYPQLDTLVLGYEAKSRGTYTLGGGTLAVFNNNPGGTNGATLFGGAAEVVGYSGSGAFIQTGGTNSCAGHGGILDVGFDSMAIGSYSLSGGTLTTANDNTINQSGRYNPPIIASEFIGDSGTGTFTQTGGSNSCTGVDGNLYVGLNAGASGTYNLSGGTLSALTEQISLNGNGSFTQTGGVNTTSNLDIGGEFDVNARTLTEGVYTLTGGELSVTNLLDVGVGLGGYGRLSLEGGSATAGSVIANEVFLTSAAGSNTYGNLTVTGECSISDLVLGIGGEPSTNEFGLLTLNGGSSFLENLDITFLNGFTPAIGNTYDFLIAQNLSAVFTDVNSPYPVQLNYTSTSVSITFLPEPSGVVILALSAGMLLRRRHGNRGRRAHQRTDIGSAIRARPAEIPC